MAASQIDIKIRTLIEGMQGIQNLVTQLQSIQGAASGLPRSTTSAAAGIAGIGASSKGSGAGVGSLSAKLKELSQHTSNTKAGFADFLTGMDSANGGLALLRKGLTGAAVAFAGFLALKGLKEMADFAARTETLGATLTVVARNAGYSTGEISTFETSLAKLGITTQAARESMTAMIQAGIPLGVQTGQSASNVERLARAAQDLAVVTGENSSETLKRLTTNIQQMDTMGLRFMGLTVNIEAAQEKFAQSIGKSSSALSQQQKVMAVNNAVLSEAMKLEGAYIESMETVGKKIASLTRYKDNLADTIGAKLLPAYASLVDAATLMLATFDKQAKAFDSTGEASKNFGASMRTTMNQVVEMATAISGAFANNEIAADLANLGSNIIGIIGDMATSIVPLLELFHVFDILKIALKATVGFVAALRDGLKFLEMGLLDVGAIAQATASKVATGWGLLAKGMGLKSIGEGLLELGKEMDAMAVKSYSAASVIGKDFMAGRTAVGELESGVKAADVSLSSFGKATSFKAVSADIDKLAEATARYGKGNSQVQVSAQLLGADLVKLVKAGKLTESQFDALAEGAALAGVKMPAGFKNGAEALATVAQAAIDARKEMEGFSTVKNFDETTAAITRLSQMQKDGVLNTTELKEAFDILTARMELFKKQAKSLEKVTIAESTLRGIGGKLSDEYQNAFTNIKVGAEELQTGVSKAFAETSGALSSFIQTSQVTADQFQQLFDKDLGTAKTTGEVNNLASALVVARQKAEELGAVGNFEEQEAWLHKITAAAERTGAQFDKVFNGSLAKATTTEEFIRLQQEVVRTGELTGKTAQWMADRLASVAIAARRAAEDMQASGISDALKNVGITAEEATGKASRSMETLAQSLKLLEHDANVTADGYYKAFSKAVDQSKGVAELGLFKDALRSAFDSGKIGWAEYQAGIQQTSIKFEGLLKAQIASAKTKEDFAILTQEVTALGASGAISGTQVASGLRLIKDAASGAKEELKRLSEEVASIAKANLGVAQAQSGLNSAGIDLQKSRNVLLKAELADRVKSTDATKADVLAAQASVAASESKLQVQQAIVQSKLAELEVAKAIAEVTKAEAAFKRDGTDAQKAALDAAINASDAAKTQANYASAAVADAQALAAATEDAAAQARAYADNLGDAAKNSNEIRSTTGDGGEGTPEYDRGGNRVGTRDAGGTFHSGPSASSSIKLSVDMTDAEFIDAVAKAKGGGSRQPIYSRNAPTGGDTVDQMILKITAEREAKKAKERADFAASEQAKLKDAQDKTAQEESARLAKVQADKEASAQRMADADSAAAMSAREGADATLRWSNHASELEKAMKQIEETGKAAAESATGAANSFIGNARSIHEELMAANGDEEGVALSRFESRRRELGLQYEQLKLQIQIARVQATAAGVDTYALDQAAGNAAIAQNQAVADLAVLEGKALTKARDAKLKSTKTTSEASTSASKAEANGIREVTAATKELGDAQRANSLAEVGSAALAQDRLKALTKEAQLRGMFNTRSGVGASVANNPDNTSGGFSKGSLNAVDVSKVTLNVGGSEVPIYTDPSQRADLLNLLTKLSKRAG